MSAVFADTFYWIAITDSSDSFHERALALTAACASVSLVTTDVELYAARFNKGYSLTDCISMQTMRHLGVTDVLTNDRHFEQEGFRALFRDSEALP